MVLNCHDGSRATRSSRQRRSVQDVREFPLVSMSPLLEPCAQGGKGGGKEDESATFRQAILEPIVGIALDEALQALRETRHLDVDVGSVNGELLEDLVILAGVEDPRVAQPLISWCQTSRGVATRGKSVLVPGPNWLATFGELLLLKCSDVEQYLFNLLVSELSVKGGHLIVLAVLDDSCHSSV